MDLSTLNGILLDFDGTLVDSEPIHFKANAHAFKEAGHQIDESEYYLHWSLMGAGAAGEIQRYGLKGLDAEKLKKKGKFPVS